MTAPMQIALTASPLAVYFYILSVLHGGTRPRMVPGPADVALLAFGLGGLVAFGPFGIAVLGRVVGVDAGILAWSIWVGLLVLWASVLAGSATLRVTIYNVQPDELERAVREALDSLEGQFGRTLKGFEDPKRGAGIMVKSTRFLRSGSVEAYGQNPETLIRELKPKLRTALAAFPQQSQGMSLAMIGLACLSMVVPVSGFFITNPRAKEALKMLMQSLRWW